MFYLESYVGIKKILCNIILDSSLNKLEKINMMEAITYMDKYANNFGELIGGITSTLNPLSLKSVQCYEKWFTNIDISDIFTIRKQIPNYKSDILRRDFTIDFTRIYKSIPDNILRIWDKSKQWIDKLNKNILDFYNLDIYQNNRDSLMFLSDLNYLQDDIVKTKKATNISDEDLSKLYSMTVRVALPKWIANKIDTSSKFIYPFLSQDKHLIFKDLIPYENVRTDSLKNVKEEVSHITDNGKRYFDYLTDNVMTKVYLNMSLYDYKKLIERFYKIEFEYNDLAICAIYYDLINTYPEIVKLINLPENICRAIEAKIYDRRGN